MRRPPARRTERHAYLAGLVVGILLIVLLLLARALAT